MEEAGVVTMYLPPIRSVSFNITVFIAEHSRAMALIELSCACKRTVGGPEQVGCFLACWTLPLVCECVYEWL